MFGKYILLVLIVVSFGLAHAQQPAYVKIGEEKLADVDIYAIGEDTARNIYIGTNKGLFVQDTYEIRLLERPVEQYGTSIFDFKQDQKGQLFCKNLVGQIFKVFPDKYEFYYQVPTEEERPSFFYEFDANNELIIFSKSIFRANEAHIQLRKITGFGRLENTLDNKLVFSDLDESVVFGQDSNGYFNQPLTPKISYQGRIPVDLSSLYGNKVVGLFETTQSSVVVVFEDGIATAVHHLDFRSKNIQVTKDTTLWISDRIGGTVVLDEKLEPKYGVEKIFETNITSTMCRTPDGTLFFGTFGKGMLCVRNNNLRTINSLFKPTALTSNSSGRLIFGNEVGGIYSLDSNRYPHKIGQADSRIVDLALIGKENFCFSTTASLAISVHNLATAQKKDWTDLSIKKLVTYTKDTFLIGSTYGLVAIAKNGSQFDVLPNSKRIYRDWDFVRGRHRDVLFQEEQQKCYAVVGEAVVKYEKNKPASELLLEGKPFGANVLAQHSDTLLIGSQDFGILFYENDTCIGRITAEDGLLSNDIRKIVEHQDKIYISTTQGFQIFDLKTGKIIVFSKAAGLQSKFVNQFEIAHGVLWLLTNQGLQYIALDEISVQETLPPLTINTLHANGAQIPIKNNEKIDLAHDQNRVAINMNFSAFGFEDALQYKYKLEGLDESWQFNPFEEHIITYRSLPPGKYKFVALPVASGLEGAPVSITFQISRVFWQRWWFIVLSAIALVGIAYALYRWRARSKLHKAIVLSELSQSQLTAIKSQMNPHFIFNALNSIQDLVLKGDVENSYTYISKFASLVRKTLRFSEHDFIEFEQEIELLELYLTLEQLRFKKDFSYTIQTHGIEDISVPPMLLQPFIENALVHGLLHQTGERKIDISFELKGMLVCTISDNGIGREKASAIRKRQRAGHVSFSSSAIERRFEILSEQFKGDFGFTFQDLSENGVSKGTRVLVNLPIQRRF